MTNGRLSGMAWVLTAALCAFASTARAQQPKRAPLPAVHAEVGPAQPSRDAREPAESVVSRVVAEALMGAGLATGGFLLGPDLTATQCRRCRFAAAFAGASATFPIGVYWGGYIVRGNGSFWLTVAAPWLVSATTVSALVLDGGFDGEPAYQIGAIGGAIAAPLSIVLYELTTAYRRSKAPRAPTSSCPTLAIGPYRDGMTLHLVGKL